MIALGTVFTYVGQNISTKSDVANLQKSISKKNSRIEELVKGNNVLLEKVDKYQTTLAEKEKEIETLGKEVDLSKYQDISLYNAMGNKSGKVNGVNIVRTVINDWNKKYAYYDNGQIIFKCEPGAKEVCLKVINKMPTYPFSYYFLAKCLKEENDSLWVEMAQKAKTILQKTTQIAGHKADHDDALKEITNWLKR